MVARNPLVLVSGQIQELPAGDTVNGATGGGGSFAFTQVEVNLGTRGTRSGSFTIAGAALTIGKAVLIQQAKAAYTGKGTLTDESQMDQVRVVGVVTSATQISCDWVCDFPVLGNFKFNYVIGG